MEPNKGERMKTFEWRYTKRPGDSEPVLSLLELFGENGIMFWGILKKHNNYYEPILLNRERNGYVGIKELLSLEDGKQAMEKKLFDEDIIKDGDTLVDHTE
jgi:hypothetical protein